MDSSLKGHVTGSYDDKYPSEGQEMKVPVWKDALSEATSE
jgi:hypothetical protein